MSAEDYTRGTHLRHTRDKSAPEQGAHHFKIECKPPLCDDDETPRTTYLSRSNPTPMYHRGRAVAHGSQLASLYCVGMLLTISAAWGWPYLCAFVLIAGPLIGLHRVRQGAA